MTCGVLAWLCILIFDSAHLNTCYSDDVVLPYSRFTVLISPRAVSQVLRLWAVSFARARDARKERVSQGPRIVHAGHGSSARVGRHRALACAAVLCLHAGLHEWSKSVRARRTYLVVPLLSTAPSEPLLSVPTMQSLKPSRPLPTLWKPCCKALAMPGIWRSVVSTIARAQGECGAPQAAQPLRARFVRVCAQPQAGGRGMW